MNQFVASLQQQMSNSNQGVKTIKCPFDPSHVMPYERFLNHLQKCQFPDKKSYRKCKFNPYHVIYMDLIHSHQNSCPDKKKYEVEEDDWGVDSPQEDMPIKKQEKSEVSFSTSFSSSKVSDTTFSSNSTYQKPKGKIENRSKQQKQAKKVKQNSVFFVQDIQDFNPTMK